MLKQITELDDLVGRGINDVHVIGTYEQVVVLELFNLTSGEKTFAVLRGGYEIEDWGDRDVYPTLTLDKGVDEDFLYNHGLKMGLLDQAEYDVIAARRRSLQQLNKAKDKANDMAQVLSTVARYNDDPTFKQQVLKHINGHY